MLLTNYAVYDQIIVILHPYIPKLISGMKNVKKEKLHTNFCMHRCTYIDPYFDGL
jgi:hypothetical protein